MFESSLLTALKADHGLVALVARHNNEPAIFSEAAPEGCTLPYVTFSISKYETEVPAVDRFNIYVDFWDRSGSSLRARAASQRIEFILDRKILQHERFDSIRLFHSSAGPVPDTDPREIHYNNQFQARAGRKAWAAQA
jgi:hypothetical protein